MGNALQEAISNEELHNGPTIHWMSHPSRTAFIATQATANYDQSEDVSREER